MATNKEILLKFINEQSQRVQSDISRQGYKRDSPYVDRPKNVIQGQPGQPTPITMQGVDKTLMGTDEHGNQKIMHPGQEYEFPGSEVTETPIAKNGGDMIKRADGSYSHRGLWDNIRAAKGSGKKATAQMLQQEKKIKSEYKNGGSLLTKTITCNNCGWSWKAADGGNDVNTCHKCGKEVLIKAQAGGDTYKFGPIPITNGDFYDVDLTKQQYGGGNMIDVSVNQPIVVPSQGSYPLSYRDRGPVNAAGIPSDEEGVLFTNAKKVSRIDEQGKPLTRNQIAENQIMWNAQKQAYGPAQQDFNIWKNNEQNTSQGFYNTKEYDKLISKRNEGPDVGIEGLCDPNFSHTKCGISKQGAKENKADWSKKQLGGENQDELEWIKKYVSSPKYRERITNAGYDNPDKQINKRLQNLENVNIAENPNIQGSQYNPNENTIETNYPADLEYYNIHKNLYPTRPELSSVIAHELAHAETNRSHSATSLLNKHDREQLKNRLVPDADEDLQVYIDNYLRQDKSHHNIIPEENKADINAYRYDLRNQYDAGTQDFTKEHLDKSPSSFAKERLLKNYSDEDLIWLMNNVAQNNSDNNQMPIAQIGGLTFLQPTSNKLPEGYIIPYSVPSTERAGSIGGTNGEPAYLIPNFKYGHPIYDPVEEFKRTGEHLGGPFKTWQEADEWERTVRHPAVEKKQTIMFPQEQFQYGGDKFLPKDERDNSRASVDNTRVNNFNDARLFSKTARNKTQKEIDKEIIEERNKKIEASINASQHGGHYTKENWRQKLADETQATGDKLRIFPNDAHSAIDDYLNPGVFIGNMASKLGSAPLRAQQEDSYMPYVTSIGEPVVMGAVGELAAPYINKAGKVVKKALGTEEGLLSNAYKINPYAERLNNPNKSYRVAGMNAFEDFQNTGVLRSIAPKIETNFAEGILPARPTSFPSFQKGYADMSYASPKGAVVFETELPTFRRGDINPVTGFPIRGRHYAHRVINPETGGALSEIPAADIKVFGDKPHWLQGYKEVGNTNSGFKTSIAPELRQGLRTAGLSFASSVENTGNISKNLKNLNFAKDWASKYGYELPENLTRISQSDELTNRTIRGLANRHNTFVRGVSTNWEHLAQKNPEIIKHLENQGFNLETEEGSKAAAEYMSSHQPINTGYGRFGLKENENALYLSNSVPTAEGYTYGNGYVVKVKRPTDFSSANREDWLTNNDFDVNLGFKGSPFGKGIVKNDYIKRFPTNFRETLAITGDPDKMVKLQNAVKQKELIYNDLAHQSWRNYNDKIDLLKYKTDPDYRNRFFIDDAENRFFLRNSPNIFDKMHMKYLQNAKNLSETYYNSLPLVDIVKGVYGDPDVWKAFGKNLFGKLDPFSHYAIKGKEGEKVLEVLRSTKVNPETWENTSRAHINKYTNKLTRRKEGGENINYKFQIGSNALSKFITPKEMGGLFYKDENGTLPHNQSVKKYLAPEQTLINFMTKMQKENGGAVPFEDYYKANIINSRNKS